VHNSAGPDIAGGCVTRDLRAQGQGWIAWREGKEVREGLELQGRYIFAHGVAFSVAAPRRRH
jgi:hypothetical protein